MLLLHCTYMGVSDHERNLPLAPTARVTRKLRSAQLRAHVDVVHLAERLGRRAVHADLGSAARATGPEMVKSRRGRRGLLSTGARFRPNRASPERASVESPRDGTGREREEEMRERGRERTRGILLTLAA